ncbi:Carboxylesterase 5A [Mactra antiquata]
MAIDWVHQHISNFNGDKNRISLVGSSLGGSNAILQALHPDNKGIIKRVIALGGTPFPTYKFSNFVKNTNGMLLVESVGCNLKTSEESMKCLRDKPLTDLYSGLDSLPYSLSFTPVVDHDFVISEPHTMLTGTGKDIDKAKECFGSIDLMLGLSNMEGGVHVVLMWSNILNENPNTFTLNQTDFIDIVVPTAMDIIFGEHVPDAIIQNVVFQYADRTDTNAKRRQNVVDISTDIDVAAPILKTAHFHYNISTKSTYMYQFSGNLSLDMQLTPTWLEGANHGTEVYFMFGFSHRMIETWTHTAGFVPTKTERITSAKMMTLLSNFIESGNPNTPDDPGSNVDEWQPYNDVTTSYLDISHDQLSANENFREPHMTFWTKIVPSLVDMIEINNEENDDNATICNCDSHSNDDDDDLWFKLNPRLAENVILTLIIMLGCVLIALIIICLLTVARQNTGEYNMKTKGNK